MKPHRKHSSSYDSYLKRKFHNFLYMYICYVYVSIGCFTFECRLKMMNATCNNNYARTKPHWDKRWEEIYFLVANIHNMYCNGVFCSKVWCSCLLSIATHQIIYIYIECCAYQNTVFDTIEIDIPKCILCLNAIYWSVNFVYLCIMWMVRSSTNDNSNKI